MAKERFFEIAESVRNWGRWGNDDQRGTLNFIDDKAILRASEAVIEGKAFSLTLPLSEHEGIQLGFIEGRVNPSLHMIAINNPLSTDPEWIRSSEDTVTMALQCATHWDALAHISYKGNLYNGFGSETISDSGATYCGIEVVGPLVSRGILLDVARAKNTDMLEPGYAITEDDLDLALELGKIEPAKGDIYLVRTGQMHHLGLSTHSMRDLVKYTWPTPGLSMETARWFHRHNAGAVATDTLVLEVYPCEEDDVYLPVHILHLVEMGLLQGQNWLLDPLADACARDGRYSFFLDATPLPITSGLGGLVAPVAIR